MTPLLELVPPALLAAAAAGISIGLPPEERLSSLTGRRPARAPESPDHRAAGVARGRGPAVVWLRAPALAVPLLAAAAGLLVLGPAAAVLGLLLGGLGRRAWVRRGRRLDREAERAGAAEALSVLAAELSAGRPPAVALEVAGDMAVGAFATALSTAAGSSRVGADPSGVLLRAAGGSAVPDALRGLAACWEVCGSTGSSLASAVAQLRDGLRAAHAQRLVVEAELSGPRATAALLAVLPLAGIGLAAGLGADPLHVLLETRVGLGCLVAGVALDLTGTWWTGRLVISAGGDR